MNGGYDNDWYREKYYKTILNKLDSHITYNRLGADAIICCWEKPDKFCHRQLVAEWFKEAGYNIKELE